MKSKILILLLAVLVPLNLYGWELKLQKKILEKRRSSLNLQKERLILFENIPVEKRVSLIFKKNDSLFIAAPKDSLAVVPDTIVGFYVENSYLDWSQIPYETYSTTEKLRKNEERLWRKNIQEGNLQGGARKSDKSIFDIEIPMRLPANIFGSQSVSLKLSGYRRISFEGSQEKREGEVQSDNYSKNGSFNLKMDQKYNFSITGKIGTKINVDIHQNSEEISELKNNIKINFRGDENDLIQEIDGGNTSLSLPGTKFVGFSTGSKGLFGIKTKMVMGNFELTAIAAQEKSNKAKKSFDAGKGEGGQASTINISNFIRRTYFFLDTIFYQSYPDPISTPERHIDINNVKLFIDNGNTQDNGAAIYGTAYFDVKGDYLDKRDTTQGRFDIVDEKDYTIDPDHGILSLKRGLLQENNVLAIMYKTQDGTEIGDYSKDLEVDSTKRFNLKLIANRATRTKDINDSVFYTSDYEMKNTYRITPGGLTDIVIYDEKANSKGGANQELQNEEPFIYILGLAAKESDKKKFTYDRDQMLINTSAGIIRFPDLYPFAPNLNKKLEGKREKTNDYFGLERGNLTLDSIYCLPGLYVPPTVSSSIQDKIRLELSYEGSSSRQSYVNLPATNITSVHVTLGSEELKEGKDYQVNKEMGQITFISDKIHNRPTDKLSIDYEYEPLFKVGQTTLLGTRGIYTFNENFKMGGTFLYRSEKSIDKKPRLGGEPKMNTVMDFDVSYKSNPKFLNSLVNWLPFYYSENPSSFSMEAEIGYSMPDHNVSKYKAAYIDDFEGSRISDGFGTYRYNWSKSSHPVNTLSRGRLIWYNTTSTYTYEQIWKNKKVDSRNNRVNVLEFIYLPDTTIALPEASWGGVMRPLYNQDHTRSKYIEIWLQGSGFDLYVDLGQISEDVNGDGGNMRTEDLDNNGVLNIDEDVGLWSDTLDVFYDPYDDCSSWINNRDFNDIEQLKYINGTKNNKDFGSTGTSPDKEDLNRNDVLDVDNNYYQYRIPIKPANSSEPGYYVPGTLRHENDGSSWRLYRVPLDEYTAKVGEPSWNRVEMARLWVSGVTDTARFKIAEIKVVENRWLENPVAKSNLQIFKDTSLIQDVDTLREEFDVSVINLEENEDYIKPDWIDQEEDPQTKVLQNEQSLDLRINYLAQGHEAAVRQIFNNKMDFTKYEVLDLSIFGDRYSNDSLYVFIRMGNDENNYYQYHKKLKKNWDRVQLKLTDLMYFKKDSILYLDILSEQAKKDSTFVLPYEDSLKVANPEFYLDNFHIKGNPSFTNIRRIELGIVNANPDGQAINNETSIWFNELRLITPNNEKGMAKRISLNTSLADLINLSYSLTEQDAFFHDLRKDFGSNEFSTQNSYSARTDVGKLLPSRFNFSIPINYSRSSNSSVPRMIPGQDIVLGDNKSDIENNPEYSLYKQSSSNSSFSVSYSKSKTRGRKRMSIPGFFMERIKLRYSQSESENESYTNIISKSTNRSGGVSLDLKPEKTPTYKIFSWTKPVPIVNYFIQDAEFTVIPSKIDASTDYKETSRISQTRFENEPNENNTRYLTNKMGYGFSLFKSMPFTYNFDNKRDMKFHPLDQAFKNGSFGYELSRRHSYQASYSPKLFTWLTPSANYSYSYSHTKSEYRTEEEKEENENLFNLTMGQNRRASLNFGLTEFLDKSLDLVSLNETRVWRWMRIGLFNRLGTLNGSVSRNNNYSFRYLREAPSMAYQFGLEGTERPEDTTLYTDTTITRYSNSDSEGQTDSRTLSSSFTITSFLKLNSFSYTETETRQITSGKDSGLRTSQSYSWSGQLSKVEKVYIIRNFINNLSFNHSGTLTESVSPQNISTTLSLQPLIGFNTSIKKVQINYNLKHTNTEKETSTKSVEYNENSGYELSLSYNFSAQKGLSLNFLFFKNKRLKFSNNMNISLRFSKSHQKSWTKNSKPTQDLIQTTIKPEVSYNFSRSLKGGLSGEFTKRDDKKLDKVTTIKRLNIWIELRF